jgi:hypothetical protein
MDDDDRPIRSERDIHRACCRKLRRLKTDGRLKAILACLLRQNWTTPVLVRLRISDDGVVFGHAHEFGDFDESLMCYDDLVTNIVGLGSFAPVGLDPDEHGYLLAQVVKLKRAR